MIRIHSQEKCSAARRFLNRPAVEPDPYPPASTDALEEYHVWEIGIGKRMNELNQHVKSIVANKTQLS